MRHWRAFLPSAFLAVWAAAVWAGCDWTWAWASLFIGTVLVCVVELAGRYRA